MFYHQNLQPYSLTINIVKDQKKLSLTAQIRMKLDWFVCFLEGAEFFVVAVYDHKIRVIMIISYLEGC